VRPRRSAAVFLLSVLPLIVCLLFSSLSSLFIPLPHDEPSSSLPPPESEQATLPPLLQSAADLPPIAPEIYDLLFSQDTAVPSPSLPSGAKPILPTSLALPDRPYYLSNQSIYKPDLEALTQAVWQGDLPAALGKEATDPVVLIYHTHGTEAFLGEEDAWVAEGERFRSVDPEENVVALGTLVAEILNQRGIPTLHCTILHDRPSYDGAYEYARQTVERYLAAHPTIRYVLDLHRDALVTSDGAHIRPLVPSAPSPTAQVMLVVGSGQAGDHPTWQVNLSLACKLQARLNASLPSFARPINLRKTSFLAEYADGALLVEIGSAANTLSQAKRAAERFATVFSDLVLSLGTT